MFSKKQKIALITACILLAAVILVLIIYFSSRRGIYEDMLESQKEAESLDAIPETNFNITGENAPDYQTPIILKTGDTPFYEGKTLEDLQAISRASGNMSNINLIPTGRLYYNTYMTKTYFYNKLTGNFSNWCSDPLCDGKGCIWSSPNMNIQYISDNFIYFLSSPDELGELFGVYRCDFQRNHVEKILDVACVRIPLPDDNGDGRPDGYSMYMDEVTVVYERNNILYYLYGQYDVDKSDTLCSLCAMDMNTKEKRILSGDIDLNGVNIINDTVFYVARKNLYKTDLTFSSPELFEEDASIIQSNDTYIIVRNRTTAAKYSYNVKTGEKYTLDYKVYKDSSCLYGDYLYYSRKLTDEEIANDPLKDYYTYTWEEPSHRPNGKPIQRKADTQDAGKIYRIPVNQEKAPEECVFQLTYKDVPVRLKSIEIDGDVLYVSFHNFEGFTNFYNQDFFGDEYGAVCYAVVDLQSGTVTLLELPKEEQEE